MSVSRKELEELIDMLLDCVEAMEAVDNDVLITKCNTHGMNRFICFGNSGYIGFDNGTIEVNNDGE